MSDPQALQKVAFLDTNTLHYIGIYLEYAKDNDLFPLGSRKSVEEKNNAEAKVANLGEADLKKGLLRGLKILNVLLSQNVQVQYAPVSELELLTGRARGKALISAAKEEVPDRMWSHVLREEEIHERVGITDLEEVKSRVDRLTSMLEESGIVVKTNDRDQTRDVLELAKGINGLIYMEAMDSIIYASALVAQANYLYTADRYLKGTVNRICRPDGRAPYEEIREKLRKLVGAITLETADEVNCRVLTIIANGTEPTTLPPGCEHYVANYRTDRVETLDDAKGCEGEGDPPVVSFSS